MSVSGEPQRGPDDNHPRYLTKRLVEILQLMAAGRSNQQIASALGISQQTAKNHVSALYGRLQVEDRASAVTAGIALGYIDVVQAAQQMRIPLAPADFLLAADALQRGAATALGIYFETADLCPAD